MYKIVAFCLCVLLVSTVKCITEEEKNFHNECLSETGVAEETVMNAMNGDISDDQKFKFYLFCFGKKIGVQNEAGEIQEDGIKAKLSKIISDEATVDAIIAKCGIQKSKPEETAFENFKCMYAAKNAS